MSARDYAQVYIFLSSLRKLTEGYRQGHFDGRRYGATRTVSADGRREKFYAEELGGNDVISFNLYVVRNGDIRLQPCEMSANKVQKFVEGFVPETTSRSRPNESAVVDDR